MTEGTNLKSCVLMSIFLLGMACTAAAGRTIYVDDDGPADFNTIQAAIDDSNNGDTVIVADGIYTGEGNRDIEFGESYGWPPGPTRAIIVRSANGPENCIIDCNSSPNDHEPHRGFRFINGEDANSVIMGFTIINGSARCESYFPPLAVCKRLGGAIYCWRSSPTISNCIISGNTAPSGSGGGIACYDSNSTVSNCIFVGNWAWDSGGGMSILYGSDTTIINCTFSGNVAYYVSGGIYIGYLMGQMENYPKMSNCIHWDNSPEEIYVVDSTPVITYSDVEGGWVGEGNIDVDPCFVEPGHWEDPCNTPTMLWDDIWVDGDYHLKSQAGRWGPVSESWVQDDVTSPCIDAGDPNSAIGLEPFPNGGVINMGAYGGIDKASKSYFGGPVCEIIVAGDVNGDCIVNFKDFAIIALNWFRNEGQ